MTNLMLTVFVAEKKYNDRNANKMINWADITELPPPTHKKNNTQAADKRTEEVKQGLMFEDFTMKKCHQCAFSRPLMPCGSRYKKLIIAEQSHCPDICH